MSYAQGESVLQTERTYIYPVTDQAVITGHALIGLEIARQLPEVDVVLTPYGAGGLTTGTASALHRLGHTRQRSSRSRSRLQRPSLRRLPGL